MAEMCPSCNKPFGMSRKRTTSTIGRTICVPCHQRTLGLAAGMLAAPVAPTAPVAGAIATEGVFRRIVSRLRTRK